MKLKRFLILTPLLVLFGLGILFRSTAKGTSEPEPQACGASDLSGNFVDDFVANYEGHKITVPLTTTAKTSDTKKVLGVASPDEKWIEVDLSEQKLRAWDGNVLFLETLVSTGLPRTPTPQGEFKIWIKLRATRMEGGEGRYYYNLPNVPYVMFFENENVPGWLGYGLHGTYWHNDFGTTHSHGCVNLPTTIAEKLYYWTTPTLDNGKNVVKADEENLGTRVIIHE